MTDPSDLTFTVVGHKVIQTNHGPCCATRQVSNFRLHSPDCPNQTWMERTPTPSVHAHNLRFQFSERRAGAELTIALTLLFVLGVILGICIAGVLW